VICFECSTVKVYVDGKPRQSISTRNVRAALDEEFAALGVTADPDGT